MPIKTKTQHRPDWTKGFSDDGSWEMIDDLKGKETSAVRRAAVIVGHLGTAGAIVAAGVLAAPPAPADGFAPSAKGSVTASSVELSQTAATATSSARTEISAVPPAKRKALAAAWVKWVKDTKMVDVHIKWHDKNGPGGDRGVGSGELFLKFHAEMMEDFKKQLVKDGKRSLLDKNGNLPTWDPTKALPKEFHFTGMVGNKSRQLPAYLTLQGVPKGTKGFVLDLGKGKKLEIRSLKDIRNPDELGRVWGESGAHGQLHGDLGGDMLELSSVRLAAFLPLHGGVLEQNRALWLETANGKAWLKGHPGGWSVGGRAHPHVGLDVVEPVGAVAKRTTSVKVDLGSGHRKGHAHHP